MPACASIRAAAGCSPGVIDHFSPRETKDFYDCIEWAGVQPWSNGKVGLNGISYYGINQWHVASLQPPHLAAMCIWEGAADWYRDMTHHGGILCTFWENWYDMQVKTVQYGAGERGKRSRVHGELVCGPETLSEAELAKNRSDFGGEICAHPLDDDYHRARSPVWSKVKVPFLSAANWGGQPLHPRGNFEGFVRAASKKKWLEAHGIEHWTHFYTDYGRKLQMRFFDHFLHGKNNGWDKQPRVQLQVRHIDRFVERAENEWPLKRTKWTRFYLDPADGALSGQVGEEENGDPVSTPWATASPFSRRRSAHETEITGPSALKLFVSSSTADADIFAVLRVFTPDLKEVVFQGAIDPHTPIGQGWLRASHRQLDKKLSKPYRPYHTHTKKQPLKPGEVVDARYRNLADLDRRARGLSRRAHHPRQGLRLSRPERRQAVQLQERADRLRAVPARRSARPAGGDFRRRNHAPFRRRGAALFAAAYYSAKEKEKIIPNRDDCGTLQGGTAWPMLARNAVAWGRMRPAMHPGQTGPAGRIRMSRKSMSRKVSRRTVLAGTAAGAAAALTRFPAPAIAQAEPFKLGLLTVKTGPLAQGGIQMEQGVLTFLKEKNYTMAGRKVDFISADTGGNPAGTKTKAQELVERDKVDVILGPLAAFELYAISDYIKEQKMPTLSLAAADNLTQRTPNPFLLRASATSSQAMHPMGHYAATELKYKRAFCIVEDFAFGYEQMGGFQAAFTKDGGCVVNKLWPPLVTPDYTPYIAQIADCDVVCQGFAGSNPLRFMKQYAAAGLKYPVVTGETGGDDALLKSYGEEAIGLVGCCPYTLDLPSTATSALSTAC